MGALSGVDVSKWKQTNAAAKWAIKKIAMLEELAKAGAWDKLQAALYIPKAPPSNQYQKGLVAAQENLAALAASGEFPPKKGDSGSGYDQADTWTKLSGSLGTEAGGKYRDDWGDEWYVKTPENVARARNEALAFQLYQHAGVKTVDSKLIEKDGKLALATKWMDGSFKANWDNKGDVKSAQADYAAHCWLANWDCIGAGSENPMDNIKYDGNGELRVVDAGGALDYKGMGGSGQKPFGFGADEWDTMRNPSINPSAAKVFASMTPQQLVDSSERLKSVSDEEIRSLVMKFGNGTKDEKQAMAMKLISRKNDIIAKGIVLKQSLAPVTGAADVAPVATPAPAPVNLATPGMVAKPSIPEPPVLIPKQAQGYQKKIDAMHAAAMSGDVSGVKAVETNPSSNQTYAKKTHQYKLAVLAAMENGAVAEATPPPSTKPASVKSKPISINKALLPGQPAFLTSNTAAKAANEAAASQAYALAAAGDLDALKAMQLTPSPKLQSFHAALVENVYQQLNPPPPPKPLAEAFPELLGKLKTLPKDSKEKVGYWAVLGEAPLPQTVMSASEYPSAKIQAELWEKGKKAWESFSPPPPAGKKEVQAYTGGAYWDMNNYLRGLKSESKRGGVAAEALMKIAIPIPEGTLLSRKHMGAAVVSKLKPGHIVADKGILSTATAPDTWGGDVHWELTVGPGVRGLPADGFSKSQGEKEVLFPPNTRVLVTSVSKLGTNAAKVKAVILPFDDGQWP